MTARTREDELREVPLWRANKESWPAGVRPIGLDVEGDCLDIDRRGNLYWDGKPVEVRHFWLTRSLAPQRGIDIQAHFAGREELNSRPTVRAAVDEACGRVLRRRY